MESLYGSCTFPFLNGDEHEYHHLISTRDGSRFYCDLKGGLLGCDWFLIDCDSIAASDGKVF